MTVTGKTSEWPQSCSAAWGGLQRCACAWFMQRWNKCIQEILPVLSCVPFFLSYAALFLKKKAYPAGVSNACLQDLYSLQLSGLQKLVCFMPRLVLLISLDFHGCTCARLDLFSLLLMYGTCRRKKKPTKKVHFSPLDIFNVIVVKRQRLYRNLSIH